MKIYVNEHILKSIQTPAIQKRAKELDVVFRKELVPNELHSLEDLYFKFDNSANSETFIKSLYTLCGEAFKTLNFGVYTKDRMGAWVLVEDIERYTREVKDPKTGEVKTINIYNDGEARGPGDLVVMFSLRQDAEALELSDDDE